MMCSSGKNAFPSMRWALLLAQHDNQRRPARARLRAYRCPECGQWHLDIGAHPPRGAGQRRGRNTATSSRIIQSWGGNSGKEGHPRAKTRV